ncbi:MAG: glycosyltransferase family 4 protein, partial [Pseudomonadota bacterium]
FIKAVVAQGAEAKNVRYFPSWVEDVYRPIKLIGNETLPVMPSGFKVMFAGNIGLAQDFENILSAAEILRNITNIHWLIVGDGRETAWVRSEIERRGLNKQVHMLGRHAVDRMPFFFAAADAMLVSLKRAPIFALTIPGKIQSYMACGRPIIAMLDGEGARIVTEASAGIVCQAENAPALADAVSRMAAMSGDQRNNMGESGRRYYEQNFSREMLFNRLEAWMTDAIKETAI